MYLMKQVNKRKIDIMDNIYITKLLLKSNDVNVDGPLEIIYHPRIKGAIGIDIEEKQLVKFNCKSLILASGGYTRVYSISSSRNYEHYGEGIALAYEAGVDLVDMEMVQFHPTGMVWPENALGTLATEAIRGEGGIITKFKK